jgi:hypothetical protein
MSKFSKIIFYFIPVFFAAGVWFWFSAEPETPINNDGLKNRHVRQYDITGKLFAQGWLKDSAAVGWWHYYTENKDSLVYYEDKNQ